ncbi:VacJ family lipoprotein [Rhodoferax sp.]|uniref:MlaA family lipoprotein n=1 Tax=Rhodoferax sp. TaxID=50421 RepID=UPI00275599B4|nr:VacJ family lipoprotein [Rhodoferax sp.]
MKALSRLMRRAHCLRVLSALALMLVLAGCASGPRAHPNDPLEPFNRNVSQFNDVLDRALLKPAATAYQHVTPALVRTGASNFFGNVSDVWSFINTALQLKPVEALDNLMRVSVNTFFGLGGLLDVASEMNIERHREDFGQTLGRWGVPTGPYLVLPILGPSTLRDSLALGIEGRADVVRNLSHIPTRNSLLSVRTLEARANLLRLGSVVEEAALDKYSFTRDVFLQRRRSAVYDGEPPDAQSPQER